MGVGVQLDRGGLVVGVAAAGLRRPGSGHSHTL